jgi:hypothetical protein
MAQKDHQASETSRQANYAQLSLDDADLLIQGESHLLTVRRGIFDENRRIDCKLGSYRRDNPMVASLKEASESSRQQRFTQQDYPHDSRSQIDNKIGGDNILLERREDAFQLCDKRLAP